MYSTIIVFCTIIYTDTLRRHTRAFVYNPVGFHRWRWISDSLTKAYRNSGQYPTGYQTFPIAAAIEAACVDLPPEFRTAADSTSPSQLRDLLARSSTDSTYVLLLLASIRPSLIDPLTR